MRLVLHQWTVCKSRRCQFGGDEHSGEGIADGSRMALDRKLTFLQAPGFFNRGCTLQDIWHPIDKVLRLASGISSRLSTVRHTHTHLQVDNIARHGSARRLLPPPTSSSSCVESYARPALGHNRRGRGSYGPDRLIT